jgi:ADP-ribose pyrophosphatase YjhB (NUDIX family)
MKFNNKENERIILPDERIIWLSRSSAVVVTIWCIVDIPYLLLGKRGCGCPDEVGKWNLPCGYLDWNETLKEAAEREVYEETGLNISVIQEDTTCLLRTYLHQPWQVISTINTINPRQTISNHHALVYKATELAELSTAYCEPDEVADLKWVTQVELDHYDYAFDHLTMIRAFLEKEKKLLVD